MAIICKYKFNSSLCTDYLPEFNSEFTGYTKTDINNGDNTITRTIEHDSLLPTLIRFGTTGNTTDRERSLLELIECNTANVTNMDSMFFGCTLLTSLNLSNFNTSKVTNMSAMFYNCSKLTSLDLSNINTSKVTNMNSMFNGCTLLTTLDLSNFDTIKVNNMGYMFCNCSSLTSLDLSNFNTSNVIGMLGMFRNCTSLTSLDLSNFNTSKVTNMNSMFYDCTLLSDIGMVYCTKATIEKVSSLIQHTANIYVNSVIPENCTPVEGITFIYDGNIKEMTHEPLRAVGDVKDRYVMVDGKWYIERNCMKFTFNGSENSWIVDGYGGHETRNTFEINIDTPIHNERRALKSICDTFTSEETLGIPTNDNAYRIESNDNAYFLFTPSTSIIPYRDVNAWKEWLSVNPVTIVVECSPTYEPIDYNPFEVYSDVTHITTNSTIPTNIIVKNHGYNMVALKENTQYTLYVNKDTTNALTYRLGDYIEINSPSKFTFTTPSTLTDKTLRIDGKGAKVNDLMLIEGTPTNDSIGYFDGLKSSYECEQVTDELDENYGKYKVTAKVVGKNLININDTKNIIIGQALAQHDGLYRDPNYNTIKNVPVTPGKTYSFSNIAWSWTLDKNKKKIGNIGAPSHYTIPHNCYYLNLTYLAKNQNTIQLEQGDTATEYEPYFESIQTIYLNSPLLKGDEIVWKDNKIQHYHKMKTVVLDGSDDEIKRSSVANTDCVRYYIKTNDIKPTNTDNTNFINMYSDKFITNMSSEALHVKNIEGISSTWDKHITVSILMSKLSSQDVVGFRQWLQQNPIKVAYELKTPYYEEISDYPLKLNVIANSSLSTESTIQVTNISFNIYEETLPYLYPNTKYYITFNADVDRNNVIIDLGGSHVVFDCKVGFNKVEIITPSDTTNLLTFSGTGVNIDHVKVTQQDIDEYFEGMKSVGECEELEVTSTNSDNTLSNIQQLTHEPLRGVGNVKDRYVLIDNKWYIERNCAEVVLDGSDDENWWETTEFAGQKENTISFRGHMQDSIKNGNVKSNIFKTNVNIWSNDIECCYVVEPNNLDIRVSKNRLSNYDGETDTLKLVQYLQQNPFRVIYQLATPVYEEIDYNPFETYADITHISTNSLIPSNMVIKNHGYNCILKPSTKYTIALNKPNGTISAKLGGSAKVDSTNSIFTITTPSTLNDNVLRLSGSGNVKDIMILEGDKTVNTPSYFEGIESVFEQEYDTEKGKYRVTAKVEGNGKESSIIFYLNEPLRGTGIAKDRVFIRDGKVIVQRNCGSVTLDGKETIIYISNDGGLNRFKIDVDLSPNINLGNISNGVANSFIYNEGLSENFGYFCVYDYGSYLFIYKKIGTTLDMFKQWLQQNPTTVVYQLAEPTYEEVECDLSKLVLENYSNSSLIFESNIPVSANIRYSGEVPVVTQAKTLSSKVDNTTLDINENIIPYMCDIDYRIVELQLMNGDTQGEDIELLGIGDIEILGNENVLFNNREDKKHNFSYDMLKRDILSQRYSKEEYRYRLDRYLLAKKISDEEYKELEGLLNNGK